MRCARLIYVKSNEVENWREKDEKLDNFIFIILLIKEKSYISVFKLQSIN